MTWGWESSLEDAGNPVAAAPSLGSILHHPGVRVDHVGSVVVERTLMRPSSNSSKFHASVVLNYSCFGFRIELALGFLPYPRFSLEYSGAHSVCLEEGLQSGSNCALDMRQNPSRDTYFSSYGRLPPNQTKPLSWFDVILSIFTKAKKTEVIATI